MNSHPASSADRLDDRSAGAAQHRDVAAAESVVNTKAVRRLTLCADDFGQSAAISAGILQLIVAGRLQATSVLSQGPDWPASAPALKELVNHASALADVGLHLNLTHPFDDADDARPLSFWLIASQLRLVSSAQVRDSFLRQIDAFAGQFGRLPDYLDGHQHVHAFPLIRDAVMEVIERCWPTGNVESRPWLRVPERLVGADAGLKTSVLRIATRGFGALAETHGLRTSRAFGGLYSLKPDDDFEGRMKRWLKDAPDGTLLMCHPGLSAGINDPADPIGPARTVEFAYLSSTAFADDCARSSVHLSRLLQSD